MDKLRRVRRGTIVFIAQMFIISCAMTLTLGEPIAGNAPDGIQSNNSHRAYFNNNHTRNGTAYSAPTEEYDEIKRMCANGPWSRSAMWEATVNRNRRTRVRERELRCNKNHEIDSEMLAMKMKSMAIELFFIITFTATWLLFLSFLAVGIPELFNTVNRMRRARRVRNIQPVGREEHHCARRCQECKREGEYHPQQHPGPGQQFVERAG